MYYVIGLTQDGKMVLDKSDTTEPSMEELERLARKWNRTQFIIVGGSGIIGLQYSRFEINPVPLLKQVDLV